MGRKWEKEKWGECGVGGEKRGEWGLEGVGDRWKRGPPMGDDPLAKPPAVPPMADERDSPEADWFPAESDTMQVCPGADQE